MILHVHRSCTCANAMRDGHLKSLKVDEPQRSSARQVVVPRRHRTESHKRRDGLSNSIVTNLRR